jgi:hypothetical protein
MDKPDDPAAVLEMIVEFLIETEEHSASNHLFALANLGLIQLMAKGDVVRVVDAKGDVSIQTYDQAHTVN